MDRNREARRSTYMAAPNGLARRRHRTSLRDSPEEDGPMELQETTRLRDRGGSVKKDRDRTRDRDRDRDRDRLSRNKRRAERMLHGSNREDGGDDTSEESVNDEEEEDDDRGGAGDVGGSGHTRLVPPPPSNYQPSSLSSSISNPNNRRNFPPAAAAAAAAKVFRPAAPWKPADEMIGVSVPRKARSASIKRSHEWLSSGGHIGSSGDHILRQASASPVRTNLPGATASPVGPISPSSSNASGRKKMKPNGPKLLPPKSSSKSSSSDQEEIEIEIAEVLYGMMRQPQVPSKPDISDSMRFESSREESRFAGDAKSRISSPSPNSPSPALAQNLSSTLTPLSVTAPKRKKPRQVKYDDESQPATVSSRNSPISAATSKVEMDQTAKVDAASPNLEKVRGSVKENGVGPYDLAKPAVEAQLRKIDDTHELKPLRGEAGAAKEGPLQSSSPLKESSSHKLDDNRVDSRLKATKASEIENQREEKFQIDLMAPPPSRSSPERDGDVVYLSPVDPKKSLVPDMKTESKTISSNDETPAKVVSGGGEHRLNAVAEEAKSSAEVQKTVLPKEKMIDLQLDLEKAENGAVAAASISKLNQQFHKQQQQSLPQLEKNAQPNIPMSYPMSMAGWPGAIPPMGYMAAPMQGVVSMDGTTVASTAAIQPPQWLFNQPRQKKCATHCYIARNIQYHQQMTRMNPFWQPASAAAAAAASASMYGGAKPTNLNVVPPSELHGSAPTNKAAGNLMPEKNQNMSLFPSKEKAPPALNGAGIDASQRKQQQQQQQQQQVLLQQSMPAGAPNNILGPAFIFPMTQQHAAAAAAAAAASVRSGAAAGKPNNAGIAPSSATTSTSQSPAISASAAATAMSFNYPNMPSGETQYLAILQNNPYPFPVPAHVGAGPQYRGNPAQAMPFFNGSFYSSQMMHPSQLQQAPNPSQQQQQQTQNASISSTSSSSQKHLQSQQHRPQGSSVGNGSLQGFPAAKHPSSQQQQQQQQQNQHGLSHHGDGAEDSDGRGSRSNMNIYAQGFPMAMHAQNFTLMQSAASAAANASSPGHTNEKKLQQQHQHQQQGSSKAGFDSLPSQAFAMSFASLSGGSASAQNLDMAPSHASMLQSLPEATRHSYQMFAAAAAAQTVQKKNFRSSEDGKGGGGGNDSAASADDDRKSMTVGKGQGPPPTMGHIAFSRSDLTETANVVDSSARTLTLGTGSARMPNNALSTAASQQQQQQQQQLQRNHQHQQHLQQQQQQMQHQQQQQHQHQQQMIQLQKQQQYAVAAAAAAARSKSQAVASGGADQFSSATVKSPPNALSSFAQNLVQSSNGPNQSPQWKSSSNARGSATAAASTQSQVPPTLNSATASMKGHPQQQPRSLQGQTQISFAAANSTKQAQNASQQQQQQQQQSSNQAAQQAVGSPTASSMSKSAGGGSPRTSVTSTSTGNKTTPQASSLSNQQQQQQQQVKTSSSSILGHKSSPVTGIVPSMLGNSQIMSSSSAAAETKFRQQQQQQQQLLQQHQQKQQHQQQSLQQTQLFFTHPYMQVHNPHSPSAASAAAAAATNAYYHGRRSSDPQQQLKQQQQQQQPQQQQQQQQQHGTSSSGMLSLCSPTNNSTCDPVKAVAASNMKSGGGHHSQGIIHSAAAPFAVSGSPHQLVPAGFTYVHTMPNAGQVKAAEQKQPAAAREESRRSDN